MSKRGRATGASRGYKRRKLLVDEEILSSESEKDVPLEEKDDFFEAEDTETPDEKRIRMAKALIAEAEAGSKTQEDVVDEGVVSDKLRSLAQEQEGKLVIQVGEQMREKPAFPVTFLKGHISSPTCLTVNPVTQVCVTGGKDCCLILWDIQNLRKLKVIKGLKHDRTSGGHFDEILCATFTDDGKYLITSGKDRLIKVWNGSTLDPVHVFKGHRDSVTGLAVQKQHSTLFSVSADRSVNVWNLSEMLLMNTLYGHQSGIMGVDGFYSERLVTSGEDGTVRVWKAVEDSQFVYSSMSGSIDCVAVISEDLFVTGHQDGSLHLWQTNRKKAVFSLQQAHDGHWVDSLAVLRNTNLVASGGSNGVINLYQVANNEKLELVNAIPAPGYINALKFTIDGKYLLAAVGQDQRMGRWTPTRKVKNGLLVVEVNVDLKAAGKGLTA